MNASLVLQRLQQLADPHVAASAAHFGIHSQQLLGITVPQLRALGKEIGTNQQLALDLWKTSVFEARLLATLVADPRLLTEVQMERWASNFDSWAICDAACANLFDKSPLGWKKAVEWSTRGEEYIKRASFSLMAVIAQHDKISPDNSFYEFFPLIRRESADDRTYVKKAVNWALRSIGKRSLGLNVRALKTAREVRATGVPSAMWIAADAIRELSSDAVQKRLAMVKRPALTSF